MLSRNGEHSFALSKCIDLGTDCKLKMNMYGISIRRHFLQNIASGWVLLLLKASLEEYIRVDPDVHLPRILYQHFFASGFYDTRTPS